jgi:hypothetical protein
MISIRCSNPSVEAITIQEKVLNALGQLGISTHECEYIHERGSIDVEERPYPLVTLPDHICRAKLLSREIHNVVFTYQSEPDAKYYAGELIKA